MINKLKLTLTFTCCIAILWITPSQGQGLHRFYVDYVQVQDALKQGDGKFEMLMEVAEKSREEANFLAEFWWVRAKKECSEYVENVIRKNISQLNKDSSQEEKDKYFKLAKSESDQCYFGVYYDNWDEINQMIIGLHKKTM